MAIKVNENTMNIMTNKVKKQQSTVQNELGFFTNVSKELLREYEDLKALKMEGIRTTLNSWIISLSETFEDNLRTWK